MLHVYTTSQKFNKIKISVLRYITKSEKIRKKSTILSISKTHILHDNNAGKLLRNCKKNNCPINNKVAYPFSISNKLIDFSEFMKIVSIWFYVFGNKKKRT